MQIQTVQTGWTLVSSGVPDRDSHRWRKAYTGLFQRRSKRMKVPVKCFYVCVGEHHFLIDAGWSLEVISHPVKHLGFGLWFASEPVMIAEEAAVNQLKGKPLDAILMTHLDCDHVSGLKDFEKVPVYVSEEELAFSRKKRLRYGNIAKGYEFRFLHFVDDKDAPFGQSADVFGDGSVTAYLTPTHSAGSIIYRISDGGRFALVVGDNGYKDDSWVKGILPGPLFSEDNMRQCLSWIKEQSADDRCLGVLCAHNPKDTFVM